ncbi:cytochrome c maturation protein CcmE [Marinithermus hydrothermalis]|uniref:Cytochrome c-type biogenesis protein CcmE n=1 Tax=Marinithermus hydrothermalis (strain DSM 14884 / JCM 11576 / T1) TaxID=869210 RepID=F2NLV1_MARHT|nr:cytochrome c maturation protein CcmE [Marinithermus hydrothermalis]AEB11208.1 Cytochrome c-type biogenesis protein ccmE [Marinithermus hydrothermalis DSM 14884]
MRAKYLLGLAVILGAIGYLIWGGLGENLVYFITPSEYTQAPEKYRNKPIRLGGVVKAGSIQYDPQTLELRFVVTDGVSEIPIEHYGTPPALFKENQGVVVEGRFENGRFVGDNLLVKHSENYQAPPEGYTPEEVRRLIEEAE